MTQPNQPRTNADIPCPSWCLQDHTEDQWHERRTLGQPYAEVAAMLTTRPGFDTVKWIDCYLADPEHHLTPAEAREVAYALLTAAAILDTEPQP